MIAIGEDPDREGLRRTPNRIARAYAELTAGLQIDLLRMDFEAAAPEIRTRTAELQGMLETIMAGVREFSYELNPDIVERAGLPAVLLTIHLGGLR